MENGIFEYFSRNSFTFSKNYGRTYDSGLLTPYLKDCFSSDVRSFIIDGEMMGWHKRDQCFGCKGDLLNFKLLLQITELIATLYLVLNVNLCYMTVKLD